MIKGKPIGENPSLNPQNPVSGSEDTNLRSLSTLKRKDVTAEYICIVTTHNISSSHAKLYPGRAGPGFKGIYPLLFIKQRNAPDEMLS